MNKVSWFAIFSIVIVACNYQGSGAAADPKMQNKIIIDSSIKNVVIKRMNELTDDTDRFFSALDAIEFENDLEVSRLDPKDNSWEGYQSFISLFCYGQDTLEIFLIHSLGSFRIKKFKDFYSVTHSSNFFEEPKRLYKTQVHDWVYKERLEVPCSFTVVLDKQNYKKGEFLYGSIEAVSNDYFIQTQIGDKTGKIKFKAYFKAIGTGCN